MKFEQAVEIVLKHEAGYVWNKNDPGGETNFGISKRSYPELDIKNLTKEKAIEIYRRDFWDKNNIDLLPACLRLMAFDASVIMGGSTAIGLLQAAIGVKVDGRISPAGETVTRLNELDLGAVLKKFVYFRWRHHAGRKVFPHFAEGWGARLLDVSLDCLLQNETQISKLP